jgi:hypothetical protein
MDLVKADAAVECALGAVLVAGGATGLLGAGDFPHPVGRGIVLAAGAALVVVGALLWRTRVSLTPLAAGNTATAALAVLWLAFASGFSTAGAAFVGAGVAALALLAAAEAVVRG